MRFDGVVPSLRVRRIRRFTMMGRQDEPEQFFYAFRLESHVPQDHLLRGMALSRRFGLAASLAVR
jgi:hypothetical protein